MEAKAVAVEGVPGKQYPDKKESNNGNTKSAMPKLQSQSPKCAGAVLS